MKQNYVDIYSRIPESPKWYDENGVPRYSGFCPEDVADIYACEAALFLIECQGCGRQFTVAISEDRFLSGKIADSIQDSCLTYGDPPNVGCCRVGASMTTETLRVLEYWKRLKVWIRDESLEVSFSVED